MQHYQTFSWPSFFFIPIARASVFNIYSYRIITQPYNKGNQIQNKQHWRHFICFSAMSKTVTAVKRQAEQSSYTFHSLYGPHRTTLWWCRGSNPQQHQIHLNWVHPTLREPFLILLWDTLGDVTCCLATKKSASNSGLNVAPKWGLQRSHWSKVNKHRWGFDPSS